VARVPEHDRIQYQAERPRLILLSLTIALAQFAALAMEDTPRELVARLQYGELPIPLAADARGVASKVSAAMDAPILIMCAWVPIQATANQGRPRPR
jgi:hypothetical protein